MGCTYFWVPRVKNWPEKSLHGALQTHKPVLFLFGITVVVLIPENEVWFLTSLFVRGVLLVWYSQEGRVASQLRDHRISLLLALDHTDICPVGLAFALSKICQPRIPALVSARHGDGRRARDNSSFQICHHLEREIQFNLLAVQKSPTSFLSMINVPFLQPTSFDPHSTFSCFIMKWRPRAKAIVIIT